MLESVLDEAPSTAYVPAKQVTVPLQASVVRPVVDPKVPAGQFVQVD